MKFGRTPQWMMGEPRRVSKVAAAAQAGLNVNGMIYSRYNEAMRRGEHVIGGGTGKDPQTGLLQFHPHADRQRARNGIGEVRIPTKSAGKFRVQNPAVGGRGRWKRCSYSPKLARCCLVSRNEATSLCAILRPASKSQK